MGCTFCRLRQDRTKSASQAETSFNELDKKMDYDFDEEADREDSTNIYNIFDGHGNSELGMYERFL